MASINKVCVIGAGVMGSGIAAQIANSGTPVILLDIAGPDSQNYNSIVKAAFDKMKTQKPPPLSHPDLASYITLGNLREDLEKLKDCDLVIEVIIERLETKHNLYKQIIPFLKKTAIIASNTSTLPLAKLKENMPDIIYKKLLITHFFNPPRYMELVELISDDNMDNDHIRELSEFLTYKLGKTIVHCNDTPGFIANRIGCFLLELAVRSGINSNLNPAKIDLIFTKLFGFPSTGVFGLYDLIGHDVMALISGSLINSLPKTDKYHQIYSPCETLTQMNRKGLLGRKSGSGFYCLTKKEDTKIIEQIDFSTLSYSPLLKEQIPGSIDELLEGSDKYSHYFSNLLTEFFSYVTGLIPSVTNNSADIDKAMKLGYSLKLGPFELLTTKLKSGKKLAESLGFEVNKPNIALPASAPPLQLNPVSLGQDEIKSEAAERINIREHSRVSRNSPVSSLPDDAVHDAKLIKVNESAKILSYQNGIVLTINSKMNCLNSDVFMMIIDACLLAEDKQQRLYIYPSGAIFSAGADIKYLKESIEAKKFKAIEQYITLGQKTMLALKHSKCQVISCAKGIALGGGCEILLHSDFIVANQNLNAGLVELGVGLIPGWGGVKEMFLRSQGNIDKLVSLLRNILEQNKTSSADYFAIDYNATCKINMHKDYLLTEALNLPNNKTLPTQAIQINRFELASKIVTNHYGSLQMEVIDFFQKIINLSDLTEEKIMEFEKEKFLELCARPLCLKLLGKFV